MAKISSSLPSRLLQRGRCHEPNVAIVWFSRPVTAAEFHQTASTLDGVHGYAANRQGLGVRVHGDHVAAARTALQQLTGTHQVSLLSVRTSTKSKAFLCTSLQTPSQSSEWSAWAVIPLKPKSKGNGVTATWIVKSDKPASHPRLILPGGHKLIITPVAPVHEVQAKVRAEKA